MPRVPRVPWAWCGSVSCVSDFGFALLDRYLHRFAAPECQYLSATILIKEILHSPACTNRHMNDP